MIAIIGTAWVFSLVLVNPCGEFPLNDDWLYARTVETFLCEGRIVRPPLAAVSLVFQTLWGAGFASIFGFSHTVLRFSNLLLHLLGAVALSTVVFRLTGKRIMGMLAGLTLLFSPLALLSAFTFMWEPSLVAMVAFSLLALNDWERTYRWRAGVPLWFFTFAAVLVHPMAMVLPIWLVVRGFGSGFIRKAWPGVLALVGGLFFLGWYFGTGSSETMTGFWMERSLAIESPFRIFSRLPGAIVYLGLFLLPVGLPSFSVKRALVPLLFLFWAAGQGLWAGGQAPVPLPSLENVLTPSGLGFVGLRGEPPVMGDLPWFVISVLAVISALGLLGRLEFLRRLPLWCPVLLAILPWVGRIVLGASMVRAGLFGLAALAAWAVWFWPNFRERGIRALALVWLFLLVGLPPFYDRYLIVLLPLLAAGLMPRMRPSMLVAWSSVVVMAVGSVIGVHDHLAVNRSRWELLNDLTVAHNMDPSTIDGGYEWAGWHYAWQGVPTVKNTEPSKNPWWIRLWAPQIRPQHVVALSPLPGMSVREIRECRTVDRRWKLFVLQQRAAARLSRDESVRDGQLEGPASSLPEAVHQNADAMKRVPGTS